MKPPGLRRHHRPRNRRRWLARLRGAGQWAGVALIWILGVAFGMILCSKCQPPAAQGQSGVDFTGTYEFGVQRLTGTNRFGTARYTVTGSTVTGQTAAYNTGITYASDGNLFLANSQWPQLAAGYDSEGELIVFSVSENDTVVRIVKGDSWTNAPWTIPGTSNTNRVRALAVWGRDLYIMTRANNSPNDTAAHAVFALYVVSDAFADYTTARAPVLVGSFAGNEWVGMGIVGAPIGTPGGIATMTISDGVLYTYAVLGQRAKLASKDLTNLAVAPTVHWDIPSALSFFLPNGISSAISPNGLVKGPGNTIVVGNTGGGATLAPTDSTPAVGRTMSMATANITKIYAAPSYDESGGIYFTGQVPIIQSVDEEIGDLTADGENRQINITLRWNLVQGATAYQLERNGVLHPQLLPQHGQTYDYTALLPVDEAFGEETLRLRAITAGAADEPTTITTNQGDVTLAPGQTLYSPWSGKYEVSLQPEGLTLSEETTGELPPSTAPEQTVVEVNKLISNTLGVSTAAASSLSALLLAVFAAIVPGMMIAAAPRSPMMLMAASMLFCAIWGYGGWVWFGLPVPFLALPLMVPLALGFILAKNRKLGL